MLLEPIYWNWLVLCGVLLVVEVLTLSLFFLTMAIPAAVLAGICAVFPNISLLRQGVLFGVIAIIALFILNKIKRWQRFNATADESVRLNNRAQSLVGQRFILVQPIIHQTGKIQIDDTLWIIQGEDAPAGSTVEIVGTVGLMLKVRCVE